MYKFYKKEDKCICPRCKETIIGYPAISRRDNKTDICSECGVKEAIEDWTDKKYEGEIYWNITK